MRITGGELKGRTVPDKKLNLRPTTNRAKQGLFNILAHRIEWSSCRALELFGGTGSLTYELASRGCQSITTVDRNRMYCNLIKDNARHLGLMNTQVVCADSLSFLRNARTNWSLIIADPPYDYKHYDLLVQTIFERGILAEGGLLVVEHSRRNTFCAHPNFTEQRKYGEVNFSFFSRE